MKHLLKLSFLSVFLAIPYAQNGAVVPLPNGDHVTLDSLPRVSFDFNWNQRATVLEVPCGVDSASGKHVCFQQFARVRTVNDSAELASIKAKADNNDTVVWVKKAGKK